MNKRQKKKHGLLVDEIKVGSRVFVVNDTTNGHHTGTIGTVVKSLLSGSFEVRANYKYKSGRKVEMDLTHRPTDLKKLKDKKK